MWYTADVLKRCHLAISTRIVTAILPIERHFAVEKHPVTIGRGIFQKILGALPPCHFLAKVVWNRIR